MKKLPKVSVVIPAYNEENTIGNLLESLTKVNYPKKKLEIIVVDDGSTDRTAEIVSKYPVKLLKGKHKGAGAARNLGWKKTSSEIVIFLDADMRVTKNYLKEIIKPLDNPEVAGCDHTEKLLNKNLISKLLYLRKILAWQKNPLVLRSVKKKILLEVNSIDPEYGYFDDQMLGMKILERGYKIVRSKKAKVFHSEPSSFKELWRQCKWIGKSIFFSFKYNKKIGFKKILFPILISSLPIYITLLFSTLWFLGIIGLLLFSILEIKRTVKMYQLTKWKESFLTPIFDYITMIMICLGFFLGIFNKKAKV